MSRDLVDFLLEEWAKWVLSGRPNIGFKDHTIIYEMMKTGVTTKGQGLRPENDAIQQERTDKAVWAMQKGRPELFNVIELHYLGKPSGGGTWSRVSEKQNRARICGISVPTYDARLATGRDWVEAYLDGLGAGLEVHINPV